MWLSHSRASPQRSTAISTPAGRSSPRLLGEIQQRCVSGLVGARRAHRVADAPAVGCTAIAVATGRYDSAALREAGADHVLETLEERLPLS
jgi:hypothetical protein